MSAGILFAWICASIGALFGFVLRARLNPACEPGHGFRESSCHFDGAEGTPQERLAQVIAWRERTGCTSCIYRGCCEIEDMAFFEFATIPAANETRAPAQAAH